MDNYNREKIILNEIQKSKDTIENKRRQKIIYLN